MSQLLQYLIHVDKYLIAFVSHYGVWTYVILFLVIFCETGLVVLPFLPGDSLLFAAGSLAAHANHSLNIQLLLVLLIAASIIGNKLNYLIGRTIGPRVFSNQQSRLLNKKHLIETHQFYEKHGGKTLILARFIPIIRTCAPFVAGVGYMNVNKFAIYNILSAILWVGVLLGAGYYFGTIPFITTHYSLVVYGIMVFSLLPPVMTFLYHKIS
jgi:membrane-associated protein